MRSKNRKNSTKSNMNSVHIAHEALRASQSFIHVKSTASHRAFLTFFARNGERIKNAYVRPKAWLSTNRHKNGQRDPWSHCPNPLDSPAGSVNGQPASNEKRT